MALSKSIPDRRLGLPSHELAAHMFVWSAIAVVALLNLTQSVRADDVWSLKTAALPLPDLIDTVRSDVHPPLYFLILHPWIRLFGSAEVTARMLSVVLHLGACCVMYALGGKLAGRGMGLLCASVYAFAPLAVLSSELVRMYSLAGLLSAAAVLLWIVAAAGPAPPRVWAAFIAVITLGSFTHIWFLCLVSGLCTASLIHFSRRAVRLLAAASAALLPFTFVWLPALVSQVGRSGDSTAWLKPPSLTMFGELAFLHLGVLPLFFLFFFSKSLRRRAPLVPLPAWTITLYFATLLPPFLISFRTPFFFPRFTIVALPALAIALATLLSRINPTPLAASIAAAGLLLSGGSKLSATECDARSAAAALRDRVSNGEAVIYGSLSRPVVDYYLDRIAPRRAWREQSFPLIIDSHPGYEGSHLRAVNLDHLLAEALATSAGLAESGTPRIYYLSGHRPQVDAIVIEALSRHYALGSSLLKCGRGDYFNEILVFERRSEPPLP